MARYLFCCTHCIDENGVELSFSACFPMNAEKKEAPCPKCESIDTHRVFTPATVSIGMTVAQKSAGVTPHRVDMGKYMKDARDKRKKQFDPNSREGSSNEYWVGGEADRGVYNTTPKK